MAHTYSSLFFHVVWSTKDRMPIIKPLFRKRLFDYMGAIIKNDKGFLISIGGMPDHVHLLIKVSTQCSISDLIRKVKANSSKFINQIYPEVKFGWQSGYGAFSVSSSRINMVQNYILNQEDHHKVHSFEDEFRKLLEKHDIKYDNRFLFD